MTIVRNKQKLKELSKKHDRNNLSPTNRKVRTNVAASMTAEKTSPIKQNQTQDFRLDNLKKILLTNKSNTKLAT
jgi:rRNA maturation endonuclease Nob1